MAKILEQVIDFDNGDGTSTLLPGVTVKVWNVTTGADVATVTATALGLFPETTVAGAVGTLFRLRIENYQGRAGYLELPSVA